MNGTVLIPDSNTIFGVGQFLKVWKEDAVLAIATRAPYMGDRDSYPGMYLCRLAEDGNIPMTELIEAIRQYLLEGRYHEGRPHSNGLDGVLAVVDQKGFETVRPIIVEHFDTIRAKLLKHRDSYIILLLIVSSVPNLKPAFVDFLKKEFMEGDWINCRLFEYLYVGQGTSRAECEQVLQTICKRIRRIRKIDAEKADNYLRFLGFFLLKHFGYQFPKHSQEETADERDKHNRDYLAVAEKVERWLQAQNAKTPFPL
ncbi:MAG: hypothetical protein WCW14_04730 [Candidatus Paceibacterota bacterium]|jgi:hypothetical protein